MNVLSVICARYIKPIQTAFCGIHFKLSLLPLSPNGGILVENSMPLTTTVTVVGLRLATI